VGDIRSKKRRKLGCANPENAKKTLSDLKENRENLSDSKKNRINVKKVKIARACQVLFVQIKPDLPVQIKPDLPVERTAPLANYGRVG